MDEAETARRASILGPLQGKHITLSGFARRREITARWAAEKARNGDLPGAYRSGRRWFVHADVAEAWLNGWFDPHAESWAAFAERHNLTTTRWVGP